VFSKGVELCIAYSSRSGIQVVAFVQLYIDFLITSWVSPEEALFQSFVGRSAVPVVKSVLESRKLCYTLTEAGRGVRCVAA